MTKKLIMNIEVSADTEADVDLELIREFKGLMSQIKVGKGHGIIWMLMENSPNVDGKGEFTITIENENGVRIPRGLSVNADKV